MRPDLSPFFTTIGECRDFASQLTAVSQEVFQTDFNLSRSLLTHLGIKNKDLFLALLRHHQINPESPSQIQSFLQTCLSQMNSLPALSLTLAFEPAPSTLEKISSWVSLNLGRPVVLNITVDRELIAGAVISFQGKVLDASHKTVLQMPNVK